MDTPYYHFATCDDTGTPRLAYGDGRVIEVGATLTVQGPPVLCERGLHASARILDALGYACANRLALCRVTLGGMIVRGNDKAASTERTVTAMLTAAQTAALLRQFARWCALSVAHLWDMPDIVRQYLSTGDESLRAAARDAAGAAARAAAGAAARAATWAAAGAAAGAAVWAAAGDAARDAAGDAARAATWAAQEAELRRLFDAALAAQETARAD